VVAATPSVNTLTTKSVLNTDIARSSTPVSAQSETEKAHNLITELRAKEHFYVTDLLEIETESATLSREESQLFWQKVVAEIDAGNIEIMEP